MDTNKVLIILLIVILVIMLFQSHITIIHGPPSPVPVPVPIVKPIGGCAGTRYGCCPNGMTPRIDAAGTNC
jgi:hypothetical protein